jgi:S1-C subfamily serine protease
VPVETVRDVAEDLLDDGVVEYAFLGVSSQPITPAVAEQFGLDVTNGAFVAEVVNGSPADDAGLRQGDIITAIDGTELTAEENLFAVLRQYRPGDEVTVTYLREDRQNEVQVTLAERRD